MAGLAPSSHFGCGNNVSVACFQISKWSKPIPYFDTQDDLKEALFILRSINQLLEGAAK
jgi:hypothetical protein